MTEMMSTDKFPVRVSSLLRTVPRTCLRSEGAPCRDRVVLPSHFVPLCTPAVIVDVYSYIQRGSTVNLHVVNIFL